MSNYRIGQIHMARGEYSEAAAANRTALILAQAAHDEVTQARISMDLTYIYQMLGQVDLSKMFYEQEKLLSNRLWTRLESLQSTRALPSLQREFSRRGFFA